jgi:ABC-type nitrate/sulfonate/bicarbonate transport system substrate-binding protein
MLHLTGVRPLLLRAPILYITLLIAAMLALSACGDDAGSSDTQSETPQAREVKQVTFLAAFKPQANLPFVGAYVAQEKGFFREQDLEVTIRHDTSGQNLQLLQAGSIQFTTLDASDLLRRIADADLDVQAVALVGQKGQQGFAVLADSGINTPADWSGKTVGYKGTVPPEFLAIAKSVNLDTSKVDLVRVGFDPRVLSEKRVDVLAVFMSNEPNILKSIGYPTKVFDPNDYGLPMLGLTYTTSRAFIAKDPDAVQRFTHAVLKGIDYAMNNRDEAIDITMKYAPDEVREHQRFILDTELGRAVSDSTRANGIGWQTEAQWKALQDALLQYQALSKPVDLSRAFTNQFVAGSYEGGKLKP